MNSYVSENRLVTLFLAPLVAMSVVAKAGDAVPSAAKSDEQPAFSLPALPYAQDALEPYISAKTMSFHYGKHHQTYLDNLNKLVLGKPWAQQTLETLIAKTAGQADQAAIFNNAAQVWNHTFFWQSMKAGGGGKPTGRLLDQIEKSFGGLEEFKAAFVAAAVGQFGSGWVWLVQDGEVLTIVKTSNADTPVAHKQNALLTCDVWEHAYYLDYQNRRKDFVQAYLDHLVNWDFAASRMK